MAFETYESFYGMSEPPFTLTPNPAFFFVNERSREGLKQIESGIHRREGFAVVSGDVGTGKTTLSWALLERLDQMRVRTALVQNPMVTATDLLKSILQDLGARPNLRPAQDDEITDPFDTSWMAGMGQLELIERLNAFLVQMARKGLFTVVILDEAQRLSAEALEQIRLLSNLEVADRKLLQIILVGQSELEQLLQKPELRQLNQRISVRFETRPLSRSETPEYVRHRLRVARTIPRLRFRRGAFNAIYRLSRGYPRVINMICDRTLMCAFQEESYVVTARLVRRGFKALGVPTPDRASVLLRRLLPVTGVVLAGLLAVAVIALTIRNPSPVSAPFSPAVTPISISAAADQPEPREPEYPAAASSAPALPAAAPNDEGSRPAPARQAAVPASGGEYLLQVSSFRGLDKAKAASEELQARGIPSFYEYFAAGTDGGWYAIYAGPYRDISAATRVAATLEASLGETPLLRQRGTK